MGGREFAQVLRLGLPGVTMAPARVAHQAEPGEKFQARPG